MAVNAYLFDLVVDPVSGDGLMLADMVLRTWQNNVPVKLGKCPAVH